MEEKQQEPFDRRKKHLKQNLSERPPFDMLVYFQMQLDLTAVRLKNQLLMWNHFEKCGQKYAHCTRSPLPPRG